MKTKQGNALPNRFLFICSQNRLRSPTAEQIFANRVETESAGLKNDAENPVTPELLEWAEVIFVMERAHRTKLSQKFKRHLNGKRVVCLDIPDNFDYMALELIALLEAKMLRYLPNA
jgi:predicted protein tyrosine phosphatase